MRTLNATLEMLDDLTSQPEGITVMTPKLDPEYLESVLEREDREADLCG